MSAYATQMEAARKGIITPEMQTVAGKEGLPAEQIRAGVAAGVIAIPANIRHSALSAEGIGQGLKTKINVNLGISADAHDYDGETPAARR